MTDLPTLETDVLVCGAGIAGLTAARTAQEAGAWVVVLEKGPETGGSSAVSAGIVWTARDLDGWLSVQPGGDPTLGKALVTTYPEAIQWLRSQHVRLDPFEFGESGWNPPFPYVAFQLERRDDGRSNPRAAMDRLIANVAAAGGRIFTETAIRASDGAVLSEHEVAPPIWDGLALAGGKLFLSAADGRLICLGR